MKLLDLLIQKGEGWLVNHHWLENLIMKFSLIEDKAVYSDDLFPWISTMENNWLDVREELEHLMNQVDLIPCFQQISERQKPITNDELWKTYFLYVFGHKVETNCQQCPKTTALIEQIPGLQAAFFSILAPGKHIPIHRGKLKGLIRYHLGLKIPKDTRNCKIEIDGQDYYWQEGKSLIFDDTYMHQVWNNTDEYRVVLFIDVDRPLAFPMSWFAKAGAFLIKQSGVAQGALHNQKQWNKNLADKK